MGVKKYELLEKKELTHDVYELIFQCNSDIEYTPGQFVTFILPGIGGRAYSLLELENNKITLIIKSVKIENGGRGGSKYICETGVGQELKGTPPVGNFLLNNINNKKLFICTGTGIVPLYSQILQSLKNNNTQKITLLFGVRKSEDIFYENILTQIKNKFSNFDFHIYLSQEDNEKYSKGYVTEYLSKKNIENYDEFYICGIPNLIDSSVEILKNNYIDEKNIFTEKYDY